MHPWAAAESAAAKPETRNMSRKPTAVAVINEHLADGALVGEFVGTVTSLYKSFSGKNDRGEWSKRGAKMKDAAGGEIEVVFWNREVPDSWKGQTLSLKSVKGEKGTHGVTVLDDEYNGKTTRKLKVTPVADVSFMEGSAPRQSAPATQQQQSSAPATTSRQSAPAPQGMSLKLAITKRATVWNQCFDAAVATALAINARHGYAMVPQGIAGLATTLYIETMRGLAGNLDNVDLAAVNWQDAKGKTLRDHLTALDRQVMETRAHQTPPAAGTSEEQPPKLGVTPAELEEMDEIPF